MDTTLAKLVADLDSDRFRRGSEEGFWELLGREEFIVYVRLNAPDERSYTVQLDCREYGAEPIGGQFVDEKGTCTPTAWPVGNNIFGQWIKFQAGNLFICWEQDRIAIDKHHPEWKARKAWTKKNNQVVAYLDFLRELLHLPMRGYERRDPEVTA